jgi:TP901 family phage tail tape measure protein
MSKKLALLVNFIGVDKMSGSLRNIHAMGKKASASLVGMKKESGKLERELAGVRKEMATTSGNVSHLVNRERELERQLDRTNKEIAEQSAKLDQINRGRKFQAMGNSMKSAGRSATLYLTTPLVAAGVASANMAKDFNASMSNISTLLDTTTENMGSMSRQVLGMARRLPVALDDLPAALYDIRSAGIDASDAMRVLEGSARLGVAGLGTTKEAADLVTSSINSFNLEGAEQARVYDLIFKTVKNGKTNISQLAQGFGGVAGTISAAGVELDEYLASVAALTTTGMPAAQSHTQLRAVISGLTRETKQSQKVFNDLSAKNMKDLIAKSGGLVPALNRIKEQLGGNDAEMLKLFGSTEALNAVLGLTGNQAESFNATLADMREGVNAIDPAFAKQAATDAAKQIENMNKFRTAAIDAGNAILPVMTQVFTVVGKLANAFSDLSPGTQSFILGALGIAAVAGPVLIGIGTMVSLFGTLTAAAATLGVGIGLLSGLVFGIPIALAAVAVLVYTYWDDISGAFQAGWAYVKNLLGAAPSWMQGIGKAMMAGLLAAINPMALGAKLIAMAKNGITAFKDYLGIKSPSRLFMALGEFTTEGLAMGIDRGGKRPMQALGRLSTGMAAAGAMALSPVAAAAGSGQGSAAAPVTGGNTYTFTFNITQQPGENAEAFARRIKDMIEKLMAEQSRGSYEDLD